jgi:hypothetical protein
MVYGVWSIDHRPWTMADGSLIIELLFLLRSLKKAIDYLLLSKLWSMEALFCNYVDKLDNRP